MAVVKFGDIVRDVKINVDRTSNPYEHYVAGDHMDSEDLTIHRYGNFATDDVGPAFTRIFKPGQVLYGSRRTYLKKVAVADFEGICANTTFVLESKDDSLFDNRLLPFIMLSDAFTRWSIAHSKGSTNPYVLFSDLVGYEFDLPPIAEQKVLADKLWAAYRLKESYKKLLAATEKMVKSQFIEMFDFENNSHNWPVMGFGEFASLDCTMTTDYEYYAEFPHIGIDSIEQNTGRLFGYRTVKEDNVKSGKYIFTPKHIIYSKIRPNLNKVATPDFEGLCSADSYPILANDSVTSKDFLVYLLRSDVFLRYIVPLSNRTGMPKVNREQVEGFRCPIPPKEEQDKFVAIYNQADKSGFELRKSIEAIDAVIKSLINSQ